MRILFDTNAVSELMRPQPDPLATLNTRDFAKVPGLPLVNPWRAA